MRKRGSQSFPETSRLHNHPSSTEISSAAFQPSIQRLGRLLPQRLHAGSSSYSIRLPTIVSSGQRFTLGVKLGQQENCLKYRESRNLRFGNHELFRPGKMSWRGLTLRFSPRDSLPSSTHCMRTSLPHKGKPQYFHHTDRSSYQYRRRFPTFSHFLPSYLRLCRSSSLPNVLLQRGCLELACRSSCKSSPTSGLWVCPMLSRNTS